MISTPTSGNAEDLSQYDPGCWTGRKTPTLNLTVQFQEPLYIPLVAGVTRYVSSSLQRCQLCVKVTSYRRLGPFCFYRVEYFHFQSNLQMKKTFEHRINTCQTTTICTELPTTTQTKKKATKPLGFAIDTSKGR